MKQFSIIFLVVAVIGVGIVYFLIQSFGNEIELTQKQDEAQKVQVEEAASEVSEKEEKEQEEEKEMIDETQTVIGTSVNKNDIVAYHYGSGDSEILFVGGIHGGYAWNTTLVAYELMDYLEDNADVIPEDLKVTVIPVLNPDGLDTVIDTTGRFTVADVPATEKETISGRFNANGVDLNRNFDCDWQSSGTWKNTTVDGGDTAFSEPESQALREYVQGRDLEAVIAWYSAAGGVFTSSCHNGVSAETKTLTNIYAKASGYKAYEEFDFYEITGDMVNWFAKNDIPAISVLLTTHSDVEWNKNKAGIEALLEHYSE